MPTIYEYRYHCETEAADVYEWRDEDEGHPTHCKNDPAHTVRWNSLTIISTNSPNMSVDSEGSQKVVQLPSPGTEKNFYAPNMCDCCSWWAGAVAVVEQTLATSDHQTFTSGESFWIDLKHGRLFKENDVLAETPGYAVKVEVQYGGTGNWVTVSENSWGTTDGDFEVNYEDGEVVFNTALDPSDLVRASFYRKDKYEFYVQPLTGKMLKIIYAEVQYTTDIVFNRGVSFHVEVYNPSPPPTRVPYKGYTFKTLRDFYVESTGPFPLIPPHGGEWETVEVTGLANIEAKQNAGYEILGTRYEGSDWVALMRGLVANGDREVRFPLLTIPFNYNAFIPLQDSIGTRIKITLEGDLPFGGSFGNVTFYCLSEDE